MILMKTTCNMFSMIFLQSIFFCLVENKEEKTVVKCVVCCCHPGFSPFLFFIYVNATHSQPAFAALNTHKSKKRIHALV